ncbi:uncharacterized protein LY89DRAFT_647875 [Mollisia scopiformis]|uniref:N-acetyltransferase domain-containing protein n=1 Tax=Mollisia scopiformis TaxID=149040 RepID=A0A194X6Q7_MOLSC|nr:uncharacterized protein LY89DRAFT_647875 [Mollisia scopiformis]KUJ15858.1 hypothetical protein LY89DRAFT_647875 [Mollisia scopiformis]
MALQLSEVISEHEFTSIAHVLYAAFHEPFNPFYELLNNTQGTYEEQIQAKAARHAEAWKDDPARHWLKITDSSNNNEVIAAASWLIYEEAPESSKAPIDAQWQPEGSIIREFTSRWLGAIVGSQQHALQKPHLVIDQLATHPSHRNSGAANMLLQWGLEQADRLGLEIMVNAVPAGLTYYQHFGFVDKGVVDPDMTIEEPSDEWKRLQKIDKHLYWMTRPPTCS